MHNGTAEAAGQAAGAWAARGWCPPARSSWLWAEKWADPFQGTCTQLLAEADRRVQVSRHLFSWLENKETRIINGYISICSLFTWLHFRLLRWHPEIMRNGNNLSTESLCGSAYLCASLGPGLPGGGDHGVHRNVTHAQPLTVWMGSWSSLSPKAHHRKVFAPPIYNKSLTHN